jgi:UDP-glucuronate 4-epimerase
MRVLVTGGAGFIGSHLCESLLGRGHATAILDDLNDYYAPDLKRQNLAAIRRAGDFLFTEEDIRDGEAVKALFVDFQPEVVVHLAARAGVRASLADPLLYERVNVQGTIELLEAARLTGVAKFVFASSSSIYGVSSRVPFREADTDNRPVSPYAATKLAGERICHAYSVSHGVPCVCLRFFTVYGPRQRPDMAIRKFAEGIERGEPVPVFGDGFSGRDYTYVEDAVDGILAAIDHDTLFDVFNIGNSSPVTLNAMIETLEKAIGRRARIERHPDQPGDAPLTCADIAKARRILAYNPRTTFRQGIVQFLEWQRASTTPSSRHR